MCTVHTMQIIPSLHLQDGKCVSWYKGQQNKQKKTYFNEPLRMAKLFDMQGAKKLQIIDLNGSITGKFGNTHLIQKICNSIKSEVQLGGGIRRMEDIEKAFELGAKRVILGVSSIAILKDALNKYGGNKIIMGIKARHDLVETDLTLEGRATEVTLLAKEVQKIGITQIIYKDLEAEGTLYHPNFDIIEKIIYETGGEMDIYSSGGVADEYDLKLMKDTGAAGIIISRAFMENKLSFPNLNNVF